MPEDKDKRPTPLVTDYPDWRKDDKTLTNAGLPEEERDWFCDARPEAVSPAPAVFEKFFNWCRSQSIWILAFGTGCGAIELRPLISSRYDISRLGMQMRPTPRQASLLMIGGYVSIKTLKRIDEYIPVDVYVTGCMPRPEAILAGFAKLRELIRAGKAEGQNLYAQNFDWYKENQKRVIKDWDMPDYNW